MRKRIALIAWRLDSGVIGLVTLNHVDSAKQITLRKQNLNLRPLQRLKGKYFFDHGDFVGNKETSLLCKLIPWCSIASASLE